MLPEHGVGSRHAPSLYQNAEHPHHIPARADGLLLPTNNRTRVLFHALLLPSKHYQHKASGTIYTSW